LDETEAAWESADLYFDSDYAEEDYADLEMQPTTWEPVNG